MTGIARLVTVILMAAIALTGAAPAVAAQDDGVGFEDMPGLQQALTRTFGSPSDRELAAGVDDARDLRKPLVALLLTGVYSFDTEANAAAAFELIKTDVNATGFSDQPLEVVPVTLPTALEHSAGVATDTAFGERYEFTLAMARDGVFIYTVIGITTGGPARGAVAATLQMLSSGAVDPAPATLDPAGGSSGGLWGKVPTLEMIEREFRGIESVEDGAPFPA
jgi:hypothetical protein